MSKLYRDYAPALLMLAVSLLLLLVLLAQAWYFRGERAELKGRLMANETVSPAASGGEVSDYSLPELEQYTEMIQRPLFMEGRRPPPEDEQSASSAAPQEQKPLTLKLMGVVFTPKDKTALFVDEKGKYRRLRKNGVVDGWKLAEVREDRVVMEQGGGQKELLLIKPKPKASAPPQPPKTGKAQIHGPGDMGEPQGEETDGSQEGEVTEGMEEPEVSEESDITGDESLDDGSEADESSDVEAE